MAIDPINIKPSQRDSKQSPSGSAHGSAAPQRLEPAATIPATGLRLHRMQALAHVAVTTLVVLAACYVGKLILVVLLVSVFLAFMLAPIADLFQRLRLPRSVASLVAVLLLLAAIGALGYVSFNKATEFVQEMPRYSGRIRSVLSRVRQRAQKIQQATAQVTGKKNTSTAPTEGQVVNWSSLVAENLGSVTEVIFAASFIPFLAYFMLSWQEHVRSATVQLFRTENRNTAYVTLGQISMMIRSYIVGNILIGIFIGGISAVIFALLHIPYFYFIGFISGFLSVVPYLGAILAIVPPLLAGAGHLHSTQVLIVVVVAIGLHIFALNVLYPKFLGSRLQLNPLAVTVTLLFWGWLWGAMGLILAIPITAGVKIICDHVEPLRPFAAWLGE